MQFDEFPKIPRLNREVIATEKLDGTNASILIVPAVGDAEPDTTARVVRNGAHYDIFSGSRTRWITPEKDNFGFARWVQTNALELLELGVGHHFGEWWGQGIQRGYNLKERRFSLFNTHRWGNVRPACCHVVPILGTGIGFDQLRDLAIEKLKAGGSLASPGFAYPEGIILFHTAGNLLFKVTLLKDEEPKSSHHSGVTRLAGAV